MAEINYGLHHRLYLHYFDRELGTSVGFMPDERLIREVTCCLLIASPAAAILWPLPRLGNLLPMIGNIPRFVAELENSGHLVALSSHPTRAEFLTARRGSLRARPRPDTRCISTSNYGPLELLRPSPPRGGSATEYLHHDFLRWSADPPDHLNTWLPDKSDRKKVLKAVAKALKKRDHEAITFALFRGRLDDLKKHPKVRGLLQREISTRYTQHYRISEEGEIPTGIRGLEAYDSVADMFPFYDVPLLSTIIYSLRAEALVVPDRWDEFLALRGQDDHLLFADRLRMFIAGVCGDARINYPCEATSARREALRQAAVRLLRTEPIVPLPEKTVRDLLYACWFRLNRIIQCGHDSRGFARVALTMEQEIKDASPTTILLTVATEVEHTAVLEAAKEADLPQYQRRFVGDHTYFALGILGGCELLLIKCEAGSGGVGGSLATLNDAVRDIKPYSIIMVGIAFGTRPDKQKLREVLVSKQMMAYDLKRVTEDPDGTVTITPRGDRTSASPRLYERFWAGSRDWTVSKVHPGLILSGDTLVDSKSFKEQLLEKEPEAIGGEMEGAGLYVAAIKGHIDWIIVKAIVDSGREQE